MSDGADDPGLAACATCGAPAGQPCRWGPRGPVSPGEAHLARRVAARAVLKRRARTAARARAALVSAGLAALAGRDE